MLNIKKMMKKKGISPVIASIILIAITVAVAIAVAGWVFGLFGTYTTGGGVTITVTRLNSSQVDFTVVNSKSTAISITAIRVQGTTVSATTDLPITVVAYTTVSKTASLAGDSLTTGMSYTIQFVLSDGTIITSVATAS